MKCDTRITEPNPNIFKHLKLRLLWKIWRQRHCTCSLPNKLGLFVHWAWMYDVWCVRVTFVWKYLFFNMLQLLLVGWCWCWLRVKTKPLIFHDFSTYFHIMLTPAVRVEWSEKMGLVEFDGGFHALVMPYCSVLVVENKLAENSYLSVLMKKKQIYVTRQDLSKKIVTK